MRTLKQWAQFYATRAQPWFVFPIRPFCKTPPLIKWGKFSTCDPSKAGRMWDRWSTANIGLACGPSDIAVIDVDTKEGKRGQQTIDCLELIEGNKLTETLMQRTPSGGLQYFYRGSIPTSQNVLGRHLWPDRISHVDTRGIGGSGGYVLLPPSVTKANAKTHTHAGTYEWINPKTPVARLDQWVVDIFEAHGSMIGHNAAPPDSVVELDDPGNIAWFQQHLDEDAPPAIEGDGGEFCTLLLAGLAKDHGISQEVALEMMFESSWNMQRCEPHWDFDELKIKVANAFSYLTETQPGAATAWADFKDDPTPALTAAEAKAQRKIVERNKNTTPASELKPIKPRYRMINGKRTRVYREGEV